MSDEIDGIGMMASVEQYVVGNLTPFEGEPCVGITVYFTGGETVILPLAPEHAEGMAALLLKQAQIVRHRTG